MPSADNPSFASWEEADYRPVLSTNELDTSQTQVPQGNHPTTKPDGPPDVSIILATINERASLPSLIERIRRLEIGRVELVFVDDGSTDGTAEFLTGLAAADGSVRVILNPKKQTLTPAQCQGIEIARGKFLIVMDSDLQHPPEAIPNIVGLLSRDAALVIGSRYQEAPTMWTRTIQRALISRAAELLTRLLLPSSQKLTDPISGFFGFRKEVYVKPPNIRRGYKLILYILAMCDKLSIQEVPFQFGDREGGESKIVKGPDFIVDFLLELLSAQRFARLERVRQVHYGTASDGIRRSM